jgi:hypothetical protein
VVLDAVFVAEHVLDLSEQGGRLLQLLAEGVDLVFLAPICRRDASRRSYSSGVSRMTSAPSTVARRGWERPPIGDRPWSLTDKDEFKHRVWSRAGGHRFTA